MDPTAIVWTVAIVIVVVVFATRRRTRSRAGPGTIGSVYDWLNEDKRHAIEMIVEERAEARDPEHTDGNLPELETPQRSG